MNHWFLVGRDVMWFVVIFMPLIASGRIVIEMGSPQGSVTGWFLPSVAVACFGQPFLIAAFHFGWIQ